MTAEAVADLDSGFVRAAADPGAGADPAFLMHANLGVADLLLGQADDGHCGHNWLTWGNPDFMHMEGLDGEYLPPWEEAEYDEDGVSSAWMPARGGDATPPYALDGFERVSLPAISRWMLNRYHGEPGAQPSCAVSFRRALDPVAFGHNSPSSGAPHIRDDTVA